MEMHPMVGVKNQKIVMDAREDVQEVKFVGLGDVLDLVVNVKTTSHPRPKLIFKMEHQS